MSISIVKEMLVTIASGNSFIVHDGAEGGALVKASIWGSMHPIHIGRMFGLCVLS